MQLGFILAPLGQEVPGQYPNDISYSYGGDGSYLCPPDPQFNTRGEQGFYYDTQLGAIPTDAELATNYGYTPVTSGWVAAKEGYFPSIWRTPGGWNTAGAFGPQRSLNGPGGTLRDVQVTLPVNATPTESQRIVDALNAQNARVFKVTIISTVIVGVAALINTYRTFKQLKRDEIRETALLHKLEQG